MPDAALVVSATPLEPMQDGKRVVLRGLLTYLLDRLGPGNVHYALVGAAARTSKSLVPLPVEVHHLERGGTAAQLFALTRMLTRRSYTLQEAVLGSRSIEREVRALVARLRPSIEIYDTVRMGQHAPSDVRSRRRVLYLDDLFSVRYERMLAVAERQRVDMNPLGGFAVNVPRPARWLVRHPAVYLPLLRLERGRMHHREAEIVHRFDASLLVNAREVELLRARSGVSTVHELRPLLPPVRAPARTPADPPEIVFVGNLAVPHNEDAVCSFLRSALPAVARRCPGLRLRIIGKNASETVRRLVARQPTHVMLDGFVADLDEPLARATAVIAPLRFGSGVKIKVLDGLARGVPLLATTTAVDGIPIRSGRLDGCLVEDDLGRWPEMIAGLTDPTVNERMSAAAHDFFTRTYGVEVVTGQYNSIFEPQDDRRPPIRR